MFKARQDAVTFIFSADDNELIWELAEFLGYCLNRGLNINEEVLLEENKKYLPLLPLLNEHDYMKDVFDRIGTFDQVNRYFVTPKTVFMGEAKITVTG